jgi:predicted nucleic acid-binding protein
MDAFDADALIYAAVPGHPLGRRVLAAFRSAGPGSTAGIGSVLLLPELLSKPLSDKALRDKALRDKALLDKALRRSSTDEIRILAGLLARLDLRPVDRATAELATALAARYRLRAADATHLATAVGMGARRFITDNKRDFGPDIEEIDVTYPDALPDPAE